MGTSLPSSCFPVFFHSVSIFAGFRDAGSEWCASAQQGRDGRFYPTQASSRSFRTWLGEISSRVSFSSFSKRTADFTAPDPVTAKVLIAFEQSFDCRLQVELHKSPPESIML